LGYEGVEGVEECFAVAGGELVFEGFGWLATRMQLQEQQQIPYGDDNKKCNSKSSSNGKSKSKSNSNSNSNSRSPAGMTTRNATARAVATPKQKQRQIPAG
jgi:hypothetical protein